MARKSKKDMELFKKILDPTIGLQQGFDAVLSLVKAGKYEEAGRILEIMGHALKCRSKPGYMLKHFYGLGNAKELKVNYPPLKHVGFLVEER